MRVLGIHDGHNASACLLIDGEIQYAIEEERLVRKKNVPGSPREAVKKILQECHFQPTDIDRVVVASDYMGFWVGQTKEAWLKSFGQQQTPLYKAKRLVRRTHLYQSLASKWMTSRRTEFLVQQGFSQTQIRTADHHLCHAAAVYYGVPRDYETPYLILTLDGGGDNLCATVNVGRNGKIERIAQTPDGDSLGNIYSRVTYFLGFTPWEHEYKLMGLAPYVPRETAEIYARIFAGYLQLDPRNPLVFKRLVPEDTASILKRLHRDFGRVRFDWICAGLQLFTERLIIQWVKECIKATGIKRVLCAGGVFMNVKANQELLQLPEVEALGILPSCGDETNSIGAAFLGYLDDCEPVTLKPIGALYRGNDLVPEEIENELKSFQFAAPVKVEHCDDIEHRVAQLLAEGEIVARAKGRMEFGARALGNRSILANPSRPEVIRIINDMIKSRDFWMPFAPSVLRERSEDYYVKAKPIDAPYMIITFDSRPEKRKHFAAACHPYDFTTRPQEVSKDWNPEYWKLIKEYEALTGEGIILNTSFNIHGYPIVSNAWDALDVFNRSGLQYLALGNYLISKV